jgi:hypothetical protein
VKKVGEELRSKVKELKVMLAGKREELSRMEKGERVRRRKIEEEIEV